MSSQRKQRVKALPCNASTRLVASENRNDPDRLGYQVKLRVPPCRDKISRVYVTAGMYLSA